MTDGQTLANTWRFGSSRAHRWAVESDYASGLSPLEHNVTETLLCLKEETINLYSHLSCRAERGWCVFELRCGTLHLSQAPDITLHFTDKLRLFCDLLPFMMGFKSACSLQYMLNQPTFHIRSKTTDSCSAFLCMGPLLLQQSTCGPFLSLF